MPVKSLSQSSLTNFQKYSSFLAGNAAFSPSSYDLLQTEILTADAASVVFSNLNSSYSSNYQHLQIRANIRTDRTNSFGIINMAFNGDTTASNYYNHELYGDKDNSTPFSLLNSGYSYLRVAFRGAGGTSASNTFGGGVLDILDPFNTSKNTTTRSLSGLDNIIALNSGAYLQTNAISTITFNPEGASYIIAGSRFSLYGLKG